MDTRWRKIAAGRALVGMFSIGVVLSAQGAQQVPQQARRADLRAEQGRPLQPVPVPQLEERLPSAVEEQRFSVSFSEPIAIKDLLLLMIKDTGLSVVLDPDVDGTFVGELRNVTLRQALDLSLRPLSLQYALDDASVVRVFRRQLETRIFAINYVATRRSGTRSVNASTGVGGAGLAGTTGAVVGGGFGGGAVGGAGGTGTGGSSAQVSANDESDLFQEIGTGLQTLLSGEGKFNIDRKAGLVQVTDYPDRLDRIATYLEAVEGRVTRQVQIQAKVIEVELREDFSAGINWSTVFRNAGKSVSLTQDTIPSDVTGTFTLGVQIRDFAGMLQAFATQGKVNVLSSPTVTAMNNEPAVMRVGTQDVFFTTTSQVDATTGRVLQTTVTPQTITEGVVLSVTPQISADGLIHMSILPTITDRTGQATSPLGDTVPIVSVRETDTLVRVHEGETVVIAGLMQDRVTGDKTKVPVLGDIPVIGGLFRRDDRTKRKTDLIILLTPTIMTPDTIFGEASRQQERLYQLQKEPIRK